MVITRHAALRMTARGIAEALLMDVIDTGETRFKDEAHPWAFKEFHERADSLLCAVPILEDRLVAKTVMHHFLPL